MTSILDHQPLKKSLFLSKQRSNRFYRYIYIYNMVPQVQARQYFCQHPHGVPEQGMPKEPSTPGLSPFRSSDLRPEVSHERWLDHVDCGHGPQHQRCPWHYTSRGPRRSRPKVEAVEWFNTVSGSLIPFLFFLRGYRERGFFLPNRLPNHASPLPRGHRSHGPAPTPTGPPHNADEALARWTRGAPCW